MSAEVRVFDGPDELGAAVAEAFVAALPREAADVPAFEVALTGGTIARTVHRAIAERAGGVPWEHVRFWWGDERFVAADSEDRNALQAREDLLDALLADGLPADHVVEVPAAGDVQDVEAAAQVYADLVHQQGTLAFDVLMLGLGPDGHVASLFPGFPQLHVDDPAAVAVTGSPKPPPERVSLTYPTLNRNRRLWFLVSGEEKAEAVARTLADEGSVDQTPARGVRGGVETVWWLDRAAASRL